jgi:DNA invertase Pin-like site-specific DNA recombinase/mRNA-degrading endonuclease YafQ of YafQ-DinJ toxin-antitoxin module
MKEKIGLLYRVSSQIQETDGGSLDTQREMGKRMSKKLGFNYMEFDEGVQSSFNVEINFRPKVVELLTEIQKPKGIRKVWVFNTDRLGRYSNSWNTILKVFLDYGVEVYVGEGHKPYDLSNLTDKLTLGVLSLISQYDNELRRMRSIMGKRNSLKSGNTYLGSTIPFGYSVEGKKLIKNKTESNYVKEIFKMYNQGDSTMDIKVFLDKQPDIKPRKTKFGWNLGTIQKMLRNQLYIGVQKWRWEEKLPNGESTLIEEIEIKTPKLIDKKIYDEVQKKLDSRVRNNTPKENRFMLRGILKCSVCGLMLSEREQKNPMYYGRCREYSWKYNKEKFKFDDCGLTKGLRTSSTDKVVLDKVLSTLQNSKTIREEYKKKNLTPKWEDEKVNKKNLKKLRVYINETEKEIDRYNDEIIQIEFDIRIGNLTQKIGEKLREKFNLIISENQKKLNSYKKEEVLLSDTKGWISWIDRMNKELEKVPNYNLSKKTTFLRENIERIDVRYDSSSKSHKMDISFNKPIIGDKMIYKNSKDDEGFKDYEIITGYKNVKVEVPIDEKRNTLSLNDRIKLNSLILELKENRNLSHSEVCDELNKKGLRTPTNKKWDKPKLSSYYNYIKKQYKLGKE